MTQATPSSVDAFDLILLGTIGLGTVAWFARRQLADKLFGTSDNVASNKPVTPQAPKRERNFVKVMQEQGRQVCFFYGSQTGTAEDYAARLAKECSQRFGVSCMTADIELYDLSYLDTVDEDCLVCFIMATYGEGEPTDNAVDFWEQFITDEEPTFSQGGESLENLRFMIFGLGNKTYEHYNAVSRILDSRLTKMGAKRIAERGEGDDDGSLEEDFLAWQETMWPAFCEALGVDETSAKKGPRQPVYNVESLPTYEKDDIYFGEIGPKPKPGSKPIYDAKRPYVAPITTRELFQGTDRHCLHVDIDISGTNLSYYTGDHVAMWPTNSEDQVLRLAGVLGLSDKLDAVISVKAVDSTASKQHPFPVPTTYRAVFRHYLDICAVASRQSLLPFVEFAPSDAAKAMLETLATDKDAYRLQIAEPVRNLGEVLELVMGPGAAPGAFSAVPFDLIVESVSRLQPRYYSISSSAKEQPNTISATAVTLAYEPSPDRTVFGVNTNFLYRIHLQHQADLPTGHLPAYDLAGPRQSYLNSEGHTDKLPVHVRRSQFKLPRNPNLPVIMIGPGTGVAPFRGFVRERVLQKNEGKQVGPTVLFFGCRHSEQDFLYKDEWPELFATLGDESRLITAFSRETDHKVYVQHRLEEHGQEMWRLLENGAYIYVCGDAAHMARDVQKMFINIAVQYGGKDEQRATEFVKSLRSTGRYQEDVWS
ncbi:NADPH-dependent cytochrome P450 oxidoreductase [Hesseltinella vesiculosa]|uniref:NADPH--cytochrome P450 reductase n=1 Tax=Hesseltinella vesiculosa TaxID=101127 RepID=A0A1X2GLA1_9FUNG|nr:NADPH-dependent cytochrome P450 oxidoreductase [Hesseltinella vesiculosa]